MEKYTLTIVTVTLSHTFDNDDAITVNQERLLTVSKYNNRNRYNIVSLSIRILGLWCDLTSLTIQQNITLNNAAGCCD